MVNGGRAQELEAKGDTLELPGIGRAGAWTDPRERAWAQVPGAKATLVRWLSRRCRRRHGQPDDGQGVQPYALRIAMRDSGFGVSGEAMICRIEIQLQVGSMQRSSAHAHPPFSGSRADATGDTIGQVNDGQGAQPDALRIAMRIRGGR